MICYNITLNLFIVKSSFLLLFKKLEIKTTIHYAICDLKLYQ